MKNFKLWVHQRGANEDELTIHPNDFPDVSVGDILEIYHAEESSRLLLQVKSLKADTQQKEIVTIDQSVASIFKLRQYKEVVVNKVKEKDVELDLVELLFKDQYVSRGDMWRLKKCMMSTCAYISKKVEICGIRTQVSELWAKGDKVTCGAITENTKIAFRSSKAMCYLFVQMSSEMWEFDSNGDLYWEKAVNGFLKDLFTLWKQQNVNNEVTIVFFSRKFYNAQSIDVFPQSMRTCLHIDYKGRIYEDLYKVIVQHEWRDDWLPMLITLKQHFIQYLNLILPSPQGINTDIICMAEQPLHATPLFRFHSNFSDNSLLGDDYNIPHWVNHSFYRSNNQRKNNIPALSTFTPRIKLAERLTNIDKSADELPPLQPTTGRASMSIFMDAFDSWVDSYYDEHDDNVFKIPSRRTSKSSIKSVRSQFGLRDTSSKDKLKLKLIHNRSFKKQMSLNDSTSSSDQKSSQAIPIPGRTRVVSFCRKDDEIFKSPQNISHSQENENEDSEGLPQRLIVGSASAIHCFPNISPTNTHNKRALINPFAKSCAAIRLTSNRRRWTHTFPQGPSGEAIQLHHRRRDGTECSDDEQNLMLELSDSGSGQPQGRIPHSGSGAGLPHSASGISLSSQLSVSSTASVETVQYRGPPVGPGNSRLAWIWGATGEQVWTPFVQTGVDWKSIMATACLPITTDYYPDSFILERDYMENQYDVSPDELVGPNVYSLESAFMELVSQRLMHGFQMVISPQNVKSGLQQNTYRTSHHLVTNVDRDEYVLSIGKIFHRISLHRNDRVIKVTMFKPRHPFVPREFLYSYKIWPAKKNNYEMAVVEFHHEQLELFNWNYMDNHICCKGVDYDLMESLKFWRSRFLLLPSSSQAVRKLCESPGTPCDVFSLHCETENQNLIEGFFKFMNILNRIRRQNNSNKKEASNKKRNSGHAKPTRRASLTSLSEIRQKNTMLTKRPCSPVGRGADKSTRHRVGSLEYTSDAYKSLLASQSATPTNNNIATERPHLSLKSPLEYILNAMRNSESGLNFLLPDSKGFPPQSFIGADAVQWILHNLEEDTLEGEAVELFQTMIEMKLIHPVGDKSCASHCNGYHFFYLRSPSEQTENNSPNISIDLSLQRYLFEVAVSCDSCYGDDMPSALFPWSEQGNDFDSSKLHHGWGGRERFMANEDPSSLFKNVIMDLSNSKTDRPEWCHVAYQQVFNPSQAFELKVQWLVSSSSMLNELLQGWSRKAQQCGFHLVPVPCDPFYFRFETSDPLSSPLFIELNVPTVFEGDNAEVSQLQIAILERFGFIPMKQASQNAYESSLLPLDYYQFVHVSGGAFAAIRCSSSTKKPAERYSFTNSPFRRSLSRNSSDNLQDSGSQIYSKDGSNSDLQLKRDELKRDAEGKVGFLWVTNHLLTKRWRSLGTGCEKLPARLLNDFKLFCSDGDGRLQEFWQGHTS
ncbi:GATOR complex protein DEPDC5-like [Anneissia japonica]|uniref:GATOR complex protein DEPDC5-like n=1 Tax=Anneissia japonica TaxID=1529436 RepID=UPI0014257902|nr:GATOR complex protein DEPDC5-like [Anneissia japonica]